MSFENYCGIFYILISSKRFQGCAYYYVLLQSDTDRVIAVFKSEVVAKNSIFGHFNLKYNVRSCLTRCK